MDLDLELVASFLALVDEWHYGRAGEALHLSPSALTKRIQRLEHQVGETLVERGPDGVSGLTAAGLSFATSTRPLLAHARAATKLARGAPASDTLRVGVPAGARAFLRMFDLHAVERQFQQRFPRMRVAFVDVPFPLTTRCLPERQVDVLVTITPVRHRDVKSSRLPVSSPRIGVISVRRFWLADICPRREARLVATHGANNNRVMHDALAGTVALVSLEPDGDKLPPGLQAVTLRGADPVSFYAARRSADRGGIAHTYIGLLRASCSAATRCD